MPLFSPFFDIAQVVRNLVLGIPTGMVESEGVVIVVNIFGSFIEVRAGIPL